MIVQERVVCSLSCTPMRSAPDHRSEMTNQLLFGETAVVLEVQSDFWRVRGDFDGYEGWVDGRHFTGIKTEADLQVRVIVDAFFAMIQGLPHALQIPMGAVLRGFNMAEIARGSSNEVPFHQVQLGGMSFHFGSEFRVVERPAQMCEVLAYARRYLGVPYLWGGRTPWGIDCSGLTQMVFRAFGIQLRRDACQQRQQGQDVGSLAVARPGDLAFFTGGSEHVGIVLDQHEIIHASGSVRIDPLSAAGITHRETGVLTHSLQGLRRVGAF